MLELLVLVPGPVQDVEQFEDHLLEDDGIVGNGAAASGRGGTEAGREVRAHTLLDARTIQMIRCFFKKSEMILLGLRRCVWVPGGDSASSASRWRDRPPPTA